MKQTILKSPILLICVAIILVMNTELISYEKPKALVIPPSPSIRYFTMGYTETVGDSWWLTAIQSLNVCEQDRGASSFAPSGNRIGLDRTPSCSYGWVFHVLNLIIELIPRFHFVAVNGPIILSVIIDDIDGATVLFEKAIKLYPNDWVILSRAASHFASEVEDRQKAALLFLRAARLGAPPWMALYAAKLSSKEGLHFFSRRILEEFRYNPNLRDEDKKYIEQKLKGLTKKAE